MVLSVAVPSLRRPLSILAVARATGTIMYRCIRLAPPLLLLSTLPTQPHFLSLGNRSPPLETRTRFASHLRHFPISTHRCNNSNSCLKCRRHRIRLLHRVKHIPLHIIPQLPRIQLHLCTAHRCSNSNDKGTTASRSWVMLRRQGGGFHRRVHRLVCSYLLRPRAVMLLLVCHRRCRVLCLLLHDICALSLRYKKIYSHVPTQTWRCTRSQYHFSKLPNGIHPLISSSRVFDITIYLVRFVSSLYQHPERRSMYHFWFPAPLPPSPDLLYLFTYNNLKSGDSADNLFIF
jgi:hypothetical protein